MGNNTGFEILHSGSSLIQTPVQTLSYQHSPCMCPVLPITCWALFNRSRIMQC